MIARRFVFFAAALVLTLLASIHSVQAEQIKLSDGRFVQGEVGEVKADGFSFKLTESGGTIFLRWSQVDAGLKKRLLNEKDPNEGLNFEVLIDGARLELVTGDVLMGDIKLSGNKYVVTNLEIKGRSYDAEDVIEGGYSADVKIPATIMKTPDEVLKIAEEQRAPLESARQFYELARIADRLALYEAAKDYVTLALAATPDKAMQSTLETYNSKLDELIRQRDLLNALAEARKAAGKHIYQLALNALNDAKKKYNPTGEVLEKFEETYTEIDTDFSSFVVTEWYKLMPVVARKKAATKNLTWQEARNWALKEMENEIKAAIAIKTGGDQNDIKARFVKRDKEKLTLRKISFTEGGFYDVVGGPLQSAGVKAGQSGQPGSNPANPEERRGSDRPRGNGPGGSNGSVEPGRGFDDDHDGLQAQPKKEGIPDLPPLPPDAEEYLRKIKEAYDKQQADKAKAGAAQDLSKFKIPATYLSIEDWWKEQSRISKLNWMIAIYVRFAGTMYFEQELQDLKYK